MVQCIELAIPPGMEDVYNPFEDAAFLKEIGAKRSSRLVFSDKTIVASIYELKEAATGAMTYPLWWERKGNDSQPQQYFVMMKI